MINNTSKKSFAINTVLNVIKQICAVVFPIFTFPYVSRALGSNAYGQYSFSFTFVSYFILIADFGIQLYAVREGARIRNDKNKLREFCNQVFTINLITTAVSIGMLFTLTLVYRKLGSYKILIAIECLQMVFAFIGTDWVNAIFEDYLYITIRYIILQVIGLVCTFVFIKKPGDVALYALILVMTTSGGNLFNIIHVRKYVNISIAKNIRLGKHILPMLTLFMNSVATLIYVNVDITMLGYYYNDSIVGVYAFASKIYSVVKSLINAVIIVAIPRLSSVFMKEDGEYHNYLIDIVNSMITIMLPAVVGLFVMSKQVIIIMGGQEYIPGNTALRILCPAIIFAMTGSFFVNCVLIICKRERYILLATSIAAMMNLLLNIIIVPKFSIEGAAATTLVSEIIACIIEIYCAAKAEKIHINELKDIKSSLIGACAVVIVCSLIKKTIVGVTSQIIIAITSSVVVYFLVCLALKNSLICKAAKIAIGNLHKRKL